MTSPVRATTAEGSTIASASWLEQLAPILQALVPSGGIAAVLYYLGIARNEAYFRFFGLDPDAVNLTTVQHIRQSVDVALSVTGAAAVVFGVYVGVGAIGKLVTDPSRFSVRVRRSVVGASCLLVTLTLAGLLSVGLSTRVQFAMLALPVSVGILASIAIVAIRISLRVAPPDSWAGLIDRRRLRILRLAIWSVITIASIVTTTNYARAIGHADAEFVAANLELLPQVKVFAKQELLIGEAEVSSPSPLAAQNAAYGYSYTGLYILARTANTWFFISSSWRPTSGTIYLIDDSPDLRVEFVS